MVTDEVLLRFVEFQSNLHILSFEGLDLVIIDVGYYSSVQFIL